MTERDYLVITHGEFGIELIKSVEMIIGPQDHIKGLGLRPGDAVEDLRKTAVELVEENTKEGKETVVLCDILGGSPSNVGLYLLSKEGVNHVVTGVNMTMLISVLTSGEADTITVLEEAKQQVEEGLKLIDLSFIKNNRRS